MKYQSKTIRLIGEQQRELAINAIRNAPLGLEVVIREHVKARTLDQQALLFAGPMKDIAEQVWLTYENLPCQFTVDSWHYKCKVDYLPEDDDPYIFELVKDCEKYHKWRISPDGKPELNASTTHLSKHGYSLYLEQVYALGASYGVMFRSNPKDIQR